MHVAYVAEQDEMQCNVERRLLCVISLVGTALQFGANMEAKASITRIAVSYRDSRSRWGWRDLSSDNRSEKRLRSFCGVRWVEAASETASQSRAQLKRGRLKQGLD